MEKYNPTAGETAETMLYRFKVDQARKEGKEIEYSSKFEKEAVWDISYSWYLNWDIYTYRIKEQPKSIPYKLEEANYNLLLDYEKSKHQFLSEAVKDEYARKVINEYFHNHTEKHKSDNYPGK